MVTFTKRDHCAGPNRRNILQGAAGAALATVLPSLAAGAEPLHVRVAASVRDLAGRDPAPLTLMSPVRSGANLLPVLAKFTEMTGIDVILIEKEARTLYSRMMLDVLSGESAFDLAMPATYGLPDLVSSNAIVPLDDFVARHEPAGFREGGLYSIGDRFDNKTYGFQADGDTYLMYYNNQMLQNMDEIARYGDEFGAPLEIPKTWEELDQHMKFFHRPDDGQYGGLLFRVPGQYAWEWWSRFHAKGMWPFSPQMDAQIASDAGVAALEEMIRATESLHPSTSNLGLLQNWARFLDGDIYVNMGWGGAQKVYSADGSPMIGKMSFSVLPGGRDAATGDIIPTSYFNWGKSFVVSSTSQRPELAYLLALFASTPEMSTLAVRQAGGYFDPHRVEHYEDQEITKIYGKEFLKIHRQSMVDAIPDLYLKSQSDYFRVLNEAIENAIVGRLSPEHSLRRAAQLWELITSRAGRPQQIKRWELLRAKYPAKVAMYLNNAT